MVVLRSGACLSTIQRKPLVHVATMSPTGVTLFIFHSKEVIYIVLNRQGVYIYTQSPKTISLRTRAGFLAFAYNLMAM